MEAKVEVIKRETVKPSSPTPDDLRLFKLSIGDQFAPPRYTGLLLFYLPSGDDHQKGESSKVFDRLKASLSETLTSFYPLAGRTKDHMTMECTDEGAEFLEAEVNCSVADILKDPKVEAMAQFYPDPEIWRRGTEQFQRQLLVQANLFACGGLCIALCLSHKLCDAASLGILLKSWAANSHGSSEKVVPDLTTAARLNPGLDVPTGSLLPQFRSREKNRVTRRYVFDGPSIAVLREKIKAATTLQPTRVEAVLAFLWKCLITASSSQHGRRRTSVMSFAINIRGRCRPPVPDNCTGNIVVSTFMVVKDSEPAELHDLFQRLRDEKDKYNDEYVRNMVKMENLFSLYEESMKIKSLTQSNEVDYHTATSWCRFPFYEADFGWGKPAWIALPNCQWVYNKMTTLLDAPDGEGIEAWVTLGEQVMGFFQRVEELQHFATAPNPAASE